MNKTIGQFAADLRLQDIEVTGPELFTWLRENGYLISEPGVEFNAPTDKGSHYFEVKSKFKHDNDGVTTITNSTLINDEGRVVIEEEFVGERIEDAEGEREFWANRESKWSNIADELIDSFKQSELIYKSILEMYGVKFADNGSVVYESLIDVAKKLNLDLDAHQDVWGKYTTELFKSESFKTYVQKNSL